MQIQSYKDEHTNLSYQLIVVGTIWALICLKIIFVDRPIGGYIEYFIYVAAIANVIMNGKIILYGVKYSIEKCFGLLAIFQIYGLLQNLSLFAVKNIIATLVIMCFLLTTIELRAIPFHFFRWMYLMTIGVIFYQTISHYNLGNTISGCVVFLTCAFALTELIRVRVDNSKRKSAFRSIRALLINAAGIGCAVYIAWTSGARTALFTMLIIVALFIFFSITKPKRKTYIKLFWFVVGVAVIVTVFYINIHEFSLYSKFNIYSVMYFDKNIDSSRPYLWKTSLESLKWWQWIIGAGTGKLPSVARYAISSFHNSYIQLLMQTGIMGLGCLVMALKALWKHIVRVDDDIIIRFSIAMFCGILAYNCFECTLLQNKTFLGITQWMCISIACIYSNYKSDFDSNTDKGRISLNG